MKVVRYLQEKYGEKDFEVIYELGDDPENSGPTAIEVNNDRILDDEMFIELLAGCKGGGEFSFEDEDEDDFYDDYDDDDYDESPTPSKGTWPKDFPGPGVF